MAKRYRFASTTRVFPTAIRHATPPKPSCALAPRRTAKPFSYSLIPIGVFCRFPKRYAFLSILFAPSDTEKLKR